MLSSVLTSLRRAVNAALRDRGYTLRWLPSRLAVHEQQQLRLGFPLLAAHLMLRKPRPFFVGIGANDGVTHDPIYPFVRDFGWRGIMVEPIPEVFGILRRNLASFPEVRLVHAAIGTHDGTAEIHSVEVSDDSTLRMSLHSSFDRDTLLRGLRWNPGLAERIVTRDVQVLRFDTLLAQAGDPAVDVLKIDTEGFDLEILKTIDLARLRPDLVIAEHANLPRHGKQEMANRLLDAGYLVGMTDLDMLGYRDAAPG